MSELNALIFVAKEIGRAADALTRLATLEEKKFALAHPEKQKREAQITRPEDERRELYNDKPSSDWIKETSEALPPDKEEKSRFQQRFEETVSETRDGQGDDAKGSSVAEARSKRRTNRPLPKDR